MKKIKIDLNFSITDLEGKDLPDSIANKVVANTIAGQCTKGTSVVALNNLLITLAHTSS